MATSGEKTCPPVGRNRWPLTAVNAEIAGDVRDRPTGLEHQPDGALAQLVVVLAGTRHRQIIDFLQDRSSRPRGRRQSEPGSDLVFVGMDGGLLVPCRQGHST